MFAHYLEFQGSEGEGTANRPVRLVNVNGDVSQSLQRRHSVQRTANLKRSTTGNGGISVESLSRSGSRSVGDHDRGFRCGLWIGEQVPIQFLIYMVLKEACRRFHELRASGSHYDGYICSYTLK